MRRATRFVSRFLLIFAVLPSLLGAALGFARGWPENWRSANWSSSGVLPLATAVPEAQVLILSTRTGRWKSIFAEHMSIVLKRTGSEHWTRYDVVGWGNPVRKDAYAADAFWYGNRPRVIHRMTGAEAEAAIPEIEREIAVYPYRNTGSYSVWPGPNSNTFVAWVVRHSEALDVELPPVAVGKDWLGWAGIDRAPSDTGFTVALAGVIGVTLGWEEGAELHFLGSTIGVDWNDVAVKLPALGKIGVY